MGKWIKKRLKSILSRNELLYSLVEGIILYLSLKKADGFIENSKYRHLRARVLRHRIHKLKEAMRSIHYRQGILVFQGESYILSNDIFLNLVGTNRYLKVSGDEEGNEGKKILDFLLSKGVEVQKMIDLGANYGEISLYFSKQNSMAKILAVEASSDNFKILESNCRYQNFSTKNITLLNEAVSDTKGFVEITKGISAENIVVHPGSGNIVGKKTQTETVACDTLVSFMRRFDFSELDFLKVDIEGSEPLLYDSLQQCIGNIKSILLEVGDKLDHKNYFPLIELLWNSGLECFERRSENKFSSLDQVKQEILSSFASDLWFIRRRHA